MPSATARLSSITGDGVDPRERLVERGDPDPVGLRGACARARGRRRSRPAARTGRGPSASARASAARPRRISSRSQRERSWSASRIGVAVAGRSRAPIRDAWISISATQPVHLGLARRQPGQDAPEPQRVLAQRGPHPVVAGGRRVALVEDQVDDLEHRRQPRRELVAGRDLERRPARRPAPASRARSAARRSALAHEERARDRGRREAAEHPQRQRDPRLGREHRDGSR